MPGIHKITREDGDFIINRLVKILNKTGLGQEVDFAAYGSYFENWRDGLSDIDGIFCFSKRPPLHSDLEQKIKAFQAEIAILYEDLPFLKLDIYLYDIFILDQFNGQDGRFMMFDADWMETFWKYSARQIVHGSYSFLRNLNPVSFRNQNEFELALGLHKLRNYLFFEIPRLPSEMLLPYAKSVLKFFKVLPRATTIITHMPMAKNLSALEQIFKNIDYSSLRKLWGKTSDYDMLDDYLREWHEPGNDSFIDCLKCFEATLEELVKNYPMRSGR